MNFVREKTKTPRGIINDLLFDSFHVSFTTFAISFPPPPNFFFYLKTVSGKSVVWKILFFNGFSFFFSILFDFSLSTTSGRRFLLDIYMNEIKEIHRWLSCFPFQMLQCYCYDCSDSSQEFPSSRFRHICKTPPIFQTSIQKQKFCFQNHHS